MTDESDLNLVPLSLAMIERAVNDIDGFLNCWPARGGVASGWPYSKVQQERKAFARSAVGWIEHRVGVDEFEANPLCFDAVCLRCGSSAEEVRVTLREKLTATKRLIKEMDNEDRKRDIYSEGYLGDTLASVARDSRRELQGSQIPPA